jgi:hypothetical protein
MWTFSQWTGSVDDCCFSTQRRGLSGQGFGPTIPEQLHRIDPPILNGLPMSSSSLTSNLGPAAGVSVAAVRRPARPLLQLRRYLSPLVLVWRPTQPRAAVR